jgi:hypothetical protein
LVANSLTVCSQQIVERVNLGAATALMQSLRTFGGMLGTALTGALLGHLYTQGVTRSLDSFQASQWLRSFASPAFLVDRKEQSALINHLVIEGHSHEAMMMMMMSARATLVESIHIGLTVAAVAALIGLCLAWFVPPVRVVFAAEREMVPPAA